jgi:hypothetical protein
MSSSDEKTNTSPSRLTKGVEKLIGSPWWYTVQLLYLMAKYQNNCVVLPMAIDSSFMTTKKFKTGRYIGMTELNWMGRRVGTERRWSLHAPGILGTNMSQFATFIRDCIGDHSGGITIIPLILWYERETGGDAHYNMLIFDKDSGILERFEPHGDTTPLEFAPHLLDKTIVQIFPQILRPFLNGRELTYLPPLGFCPRSGAQLVEEASRSVLGLPVTHGFCAVWSFIYANARLKRPNVRRDVLAKELSYRMSKAVGDPRSTVYRYIENVILMISTLSQQLMALDTRDEDVLLRTTRETLLEFVRTNKI